MAACTLDISHPCFLESLGNLQDDPETQEALNTLKEKIELEHSSCGRVVQKFYGNKKFTHLHDKIWKYDWSKPGVYSAGRKAWRLVVVVPDPDTRPYKLIAGAMYTKSGASQLPAVELAEIFSCVMGPAKQEHPPESEFRRVDNGDGDETLRSICGLCYAFIVVSKEVEVLDEAEAKHRCDLASELPEPAETNEATE